MPSHKTLKIKKVLAKKQKQNRWVLVETLSIVGGYTDILNEWGRAVIKNCSLNSQFVVQAHPAVDPNANGQHDPLQRQKASLEKNQAQALNPPNVPLRPFRHRDIDGEVTKRGNVASVSSIGGSNQRASVADSIRGGERKKMASAKKLFLFS